eukprot:NODE_587_length_2070_cov_56.334983_g541_i0.p1 GENE.NODE_587_length_2070_cov_56.334983_g541_i0~~NODE_587_length_2070_cov_56.334983_g541_i0.p1  ORF type:complete len:317 (+),score=34.98 NODE_587_length_2070_cov_56.334983_g541_i0:825-1775(+)
MHAHICVGSKLELVAEAYARQRVLAHLWRHWKRECAVALVTREFLILQRGEILQRAFVRWRSRWAYRNQLVEESMDSMLVFYRRRLISRALRVWSSAARARKLERSEFVEIEARLTTERLMRQPFLCWYQRFCTARNLDVSLQQLLAQRTFRTLKVAVKVWRAWLSARTFEQTKVGREAARIRVCRAWRLWRRAFGHSQRNAIASQKVRAVSLNHTLATIFHRWRFFTERSQSKKLEEDAARQRFLIHNLHDGCACWLSGASMLQDQRIEAAADAAAKRARRRMELVQSVVMKWQRLRETKRRLVWASVMIPPEPS